MKAVSCAVPTQNQSLVLNLNQLVIHCEFCFSNYAEKAF
jgi:hypothetical protein